MTIPFPSQFSIPDILDRARTFPRPRRPGHPHTAPGGADSAEASLHGGRYAKRHGGMSLSESGSRESKKQAVAVRARFRTAVHRKRGRGLLGPSPRADVWAGLTSFSGCESTGWAWLDVSASGCLLVCPGPFPATVEQQVVDVSSGRSIRHRRLPRAHKSRWSQTRSNGSPNFAPTDRSRPASANPLAA
jgi:hypothetical protein